MSRSQEYVRNAVTANGRGFPVLAAAVCVYLAGAWLLYLHLGLVDEHHLPTCNCGDLVNQAWFLALVHHDLVHRHFSLGTTLLDYPAGINILDNASFPALGVLFSPVVSIFGPAAALGLMARVGIVVSAVACLLALRRAGVSNVAAAAGGGLYGFSPYMSHQAASHMFLTFVPLPPVILLTVCRTLTTETGGRKAFRAGLLAGGLGVAQYFISSEVLVSLFVVGSVSAVLVSARAAVLGRTLLPAARRAASFVAGSAIVGAPLLAYPAWYSVAGPRHVSGATQPVTAPGIDALSTILPVDNRVVAGLWGGSRISPIPLLGDTAFLGVPLLALLAFVAVKYRRLALVRCAALTGVVAWILALGPRLVVDGHVTSFPLPFVLLAHVPVLQDIVPSRLTLYVDLAAAVLLAVGLDRLLEALKRRRSPHVWVAAGVGVLAAGLVMPASTVPAAGLGVVRFAPQIPAGGVVLAYPYPAYPRDEAMLWQATAGLRFPLLGGYAVRAGPDGRQTKSPPRLRPPAVAEFFEDAISSSGPSESALRRLASAARSQLPALVSRYRVSAIVVDGTQRNAAQVVTLIAGTYGPPLPAGALDIWRTREWGGKP